MKTSHHRPDFAALLGSLLASLPMLAAAATPDSAGLYEKQIRPLFEQHCFKCHSHAADKIKGGLVLDSSAQCSLAATPARPSSRVIRRRACS